MYCRNCGNKLNDNAKFCTKCGQKTIDLETSVPNQVVEVVQKDEVLPVSEQQTEILAPENNETNATEIQEGVTELVESNEIIEPEIYNGETVVLSEPAEVPVTVENKETVLIEEPSPAMPQPPSEAAPKKSKKGLIWIAVVVVIALVAAGVGYQMLFNKDADDQANNNQSEGNAVETEDQVAEIIDENLTPEEQLENILVLGKSYAEEGKYSELVNLTLEYDVIIAEIEGLDLESEDVKVTFESLQLLINDNYQAVIFALASIDDYDNISKLFDLNKFISENPKEMIPIASEMFIREGKFENGQRVLNYMMQPFTESAMLQAVSTQLALDEKFPNRATGWKAIELMGYDKLTNFNNGFAKIGRENGVDENGSIKYTWGLVNNHGQIIVEPTYDNIGVFLDNRAAVEKNGKWGFIDEAGTLVIPLVYDAIKDPNDSEFYAYAKRDPENIYKGFYNGFAAVQLGEKWGYIDYYNNPLGPGIIYDNIQNFSEESGVARLGDKWGMLDRNGNYIIRPNSSNVDGVTFGVVRPIYEGLAGVNWNDGKNRGLINQSGRIVSVFNKNYVDLVQDFREGLASVRKIGSDDIARWGFVNRSGDIVIPTQYETVTVFIDGISKVSNQGLYGLINRSGQMILPLAYDAISDFNNEIAVIMYNSKYGFVNRSGEVIVAPQYDMINTFNNGYSGFKLGEKWGIITSNGQVVVEPIFEELKEFSDGMAAAKYNGKWGYVDVTGFFQITPKYAYADTFHDGLALVVDGSNSYYIRLDSIPSVVSGQLVDESNTGLKHASIAIYRPGDLVPYTIVTTDELGNYQAVLPSGRFEIRPILETYEDMVAYVEVEEDTEVYATKIVAIKEDTNSTADIQINLGNALDGSAVNNVVVRFREGYDNKLGAYLTDELGNIIEAYSDNSGLINIKLPIGGYTAETMLDGFNNNFINIIASNNLDQSIFQNRMIPLSNSLMSDQIRITLEWGARPNDLDSHLTGPKTDGYDYFHIYFSNKGYEQYGAILDKDDTSGNGFETITINQISEGTYRYSVFDYSNGSNYDSNQMSYSGARVSVYMGSNLISVFDVPTGQVGILWEVFEIRDNKLIPINNVTSHVDVNYFDGN